MNTMSLNTDKDNACAENSDAESQQEARRLPFDQFTGYRIGKKLDLKRLERIGLVAIGRAFTADLCVAQIGLYRNVR